MAFLVGIYNGMEEEMNEETDRLGTIISFCYKDGVYIREIKEDNLDSGKDKETV